MCDSVEYSTKMNYIPAENYHQLSDENYHQENCALRMEKCTCSTLSKGNCNYTRPDLVSYPENYRKYSTETMDTYQQSGVNNYQPKLELCHDNYQQYPDNSEENYHQSYPEQKYDNHGGSEHNYQQNYSDKSNENYQQFEKYEHSTKCEQNCHQPMSDLSKQNYNQFSTKHVENCHKIPKVCDTNCHRHSRENLCNLSSVENYRKHPSIRGAEYSFQRSKSFEENNHKLSKLPEEIYDENSEVCKRSNPEDQHYYQRSKSVEEHNFKHSDLPDNCHQDKYPKHVKLTDVNYHELSGLPEENEQDVVGNLSFSPPPMKHSETRDSISSIDSDVSLSYDHRNALINAANMQHRPSLTTEDEGAHMGDLSDSGSDTGGKDSGCEVTAEPNQTQTPTPFTPPSEDLAERICQQVEFYFSDVNITKDAFLLKHVKRNKEGYVSLKLISSFKRVKHLTKDWRVVASALLRSKKLEINEAGTKLRRIEPLPQYDQTAPSRTVVAVNMPIDKPTIENVAEIFSKCGEIALIRILRPGNPIPADVRQFINKNPSLSGVVCALIEYTDSEYARKAIQMQYEDGSVMKVYELNNVPNPEKKKRLSQSKKSTIQRLKSEQHSEISGQSGSENEYYDYHKKRGSDPRLRMRRGSAHFPIHPMEPTTWLQRRLSAASCSSASESSGYMYMPRRLSQSSRDSGSENNMMFISRRFSNCSVSSSDYSSGGFRRLSTCSRESDSCCSNGPRSRSNSTVYHLPDNVVRMPQGPDGSKGFRQRLINPSH